MEFCSFLPCIFQPLQYFTILECRMRIVPLCPILHDFVIYFMKSSPPQQVTLMKSEGESLSVKFSCQRNCEGSATKMNPSIIKIGHKRQKCFLLLATIYFQNLVIYNYSLNPQKLKPFWYILPITQNKIYFFCHQMILHLALL